MPRYLRLHLRQKTRCGRKTLELFAENLARCFYGFEPDFFQQNVSRIVDDVVSQIHAALEIWPTLIEICYFHKDKREFPQRRIDNKKPKGPSGGWISK